MQLKWFLFFSVLAAAQAASVFHGEIPVKVIYDEEVTHRLYVRNLDMAGKEEVQKLAPVQQEEIKIEDEKNEVSPQGNPNALRNLNEKVQLSQEELSQATKHLPLDNEENTDEDIKLRIVTPDEETEDVQKGDLPNDNKLLETIQEIINNGIERIENDAKSAQQVVQPEVWNSFNEGVEGFLQSVKTKNSLRQNANNTSIITQFQEFASNFFGQFTGQNQKNNTAQDSQQQPSFPQNVAGFFQNGLQQIQQGLTSAFSGQQQQPATVLGDTPSTQAPNLIQGFVQQAQNTISGFLNPQQQNPADQSSPSNPIQSISNSIGQAFQNLNPFANRPPADQSSGQNNPFQGIQNALSNLNPFRQTTAKPADSSSSNPLPTIPPLPTLPPSGSFPNVSNIGQQISETISNPSGAVSSLVGATNSDNNPLQGVAQQISSAIPNNPLQSGNNPIEGVSQQIAGAISGNPIPSGSNPIQSISQQAGSLIPNNPLQTGSNPIQGVAQQVGNLVPNGRK